MKILVVLAAVIAVGLAKSGSLLKISEIPDELIKNPKFLLYEREDRLVEVEDLENSEAKPVLFLSDNDVTFYVYNQQHQQGVHIRASQARDIVRLTGFDINRNTVVITHGWRNHYMSAVNTEIRTALLRSRIVNIIVVDWSEIADRNYVSAQGSVVSVGNFIGDFLIRLNNEVGHPLNRVTLVGHSLGAHISGNAGARTLGLSNTIVGLDPAGPLFTSSNINNRLDPTDAQYVHVIHTNDGLLGFGIKMGHEDYFPNGGATQPGCGIDLTGSCSHGRAYTYFAESVNDNRYLSLLCDSFAIFQNNQCNQNVAGLLGNFPVTRTRNGDYYLLTNSVSPFARG